MLASRVSELPPRVPLPVRRRTPMTGAASPAYPPAVLATQPGTAEQDLAVPKPARRHSASPRARKLAAGSVLTRSLAGLAVGRIIIADVVAAQDRDRRAPPMPHQCDSVSLDQTRAPRPRSSPSSRPGARKYRAADTRVLANSAQLTSLGMPRRSRSGYAKRLRRVTDATSRLWPNDLIMFAVARAGAQHPDANSWFDWDGIKQFRHVNLGFAIDTGQALLVPVIRSADTMALSELSQAVRTAIDKARAGTLAPEEMDGGTFTVSNLGSLGIHWFTPVLNPPQTAILGIGVTHQDHPAGPSLLPLSLTFDHRAIDGAAAATLLSDIAGCIETVDVIAAL